MKHMSVYTRTLSVCLGLFSALACSDSGPAAVAPESVYMSLRLNHHAINLSVSEPSNSVQLSAEARAGNGAILSLPDGVTYTSMDETVLTVTPGGLLTAHGPAFLIGIIASARIGDITHTDTAWVTVTDTPIPIDSFVVRPEAGDSARRAVGEYMRVPTLWYDTDGVQIEQWVIDGASQHYESSNPEIAAVDPLFGYVSFYMPGTVKLIAQAYLYGKTFTDTLDVVVLDPLNVEIAVLPRVVTGQPETNYFTPPQITVSRGGVVQWRNRSNVKTDVTFDDPSAATEAEDGAGSGHIPVLLPDSSAHRRFVTPGTYTYKSTTSGSTGTIIVK